MPFTPSQFETIEKHFEHYTPAACPICASTAWTTLPYPGAIVAQQALSVNIYKTLQIVQQVCDTCGYILQFDARKVGVEQENSPNHQG
jgi:rubredoxin